MGPDRLHPRVLKETARAVASILQIIFKKSLEDGEVPDDWNQANIAAIFKNYIAHQITVQCNSRVCAVN